MPCNNNINKRRTSTGALTSTRYGRYPCRNLRLPHLHLLPPPSLDPHPSHPQNLSQLLQEDDGDGASYATGGSPRASSHCTPLH